MPNFLHELENYPQHVRLHSSPFLASFFSDLKEKESVKNASFWVLISRKIRVARQNILHFPHSANIQQPTYLGKSENGQSTTVIGRIRTTWKCWSLKPFFNTWKKKNNFSKLASLRCQNTDFCKFQAHKIAKYQFLTSTQS